jgi:uncharacterized phiE125 gp8 family phage protein
MNISKSKSIYPVTLDEVKRHLRVDSDYFEDDAYLENAVIRSATRFCENFIDKDIAYTSNRYTLYDFYDSYLSIDEGNLISVSDVSINGTLYNDYDLKTYSDSFSLSWDYYIGGADNTITIDFITGYENGECPEEIKQAVLIKCGDLYDVERSSYTLGNAKKNEVVERILMPFKSIRW